MSSKDSVWSNYVKKFKANTRKLFVFIAENYLSKKFVVFSELTQMSNNKIESARHSILLNWLEF